MQGKRRVIETRGIRWVVAIIQTGVPPDAVGKYWFWYILISGIGILTDSDIGESLRDLTDGLTLSSNSLTVVTACAWRGGRGAHLIFEGRIR